MPNLSIIIPSRCEMFLKNTVEDIIKNKRGDTEVIVILDGVPSVPPLDQHPDVNVIYLSESIGQRAATNLGVRLSKARWVAKCDAHCAFDEGFDVKMIEAFKKTGDNVIMAPTMRNLHVFDWKCNNCGWKKYQGPTPTVCPDCNHTDKIRRKIVWNPKVRPQSNSFCFDQEPHFQYFNEYSKRPEVKKMVEETGLSESMSLQGSFFMCTREKYNELNICDESLGSWGSQGIEIACKFWLSGGKVIINHQTYYGHCFRTQGGDFSFPYPQSGKAVQKAKQTVKELFFDNLWPLQKYPLIWLLDRFAPVPGWEQSALDKLRAWPLNNK